MSVPLWSNKCNCVYVYSLISPWAQQTSQFTPLSLENSLIRSHLLWGQFSAFSTANAIHNSPIFVPPGTHHCWVGKGSMEWEVCLTLLHLTSGGNQTPDILILNPTPYPLFHMLPWFASFAGASRKRTNCFWFREIYLNHSRGLGYVFHHGYVVFKPI